MNGITSFNLDLGYLILLKIFRICIFGVYALNISLITIL